jgi:hypothetical protein
VARAREGASARCSRWDWRFAWVRRVDGWRGGLTRREASWQGRVGAAGEMGWETGRGCSQQQQGTAEEQDDSLRCNRRARKGQRDSGQWIVAAYRIPLVVLAAVARPSKSRTDSGTARAPPDWPHRVASSNRHGHGSLIAPLSHSCRHSRILLSYPYTRPIRGHVHLRVLVGTGQHAVDDRCEWRVLVC